MSGVRIELLIDRVQIELELFGSFYNLTNFVHVNYNEIHLYPTKTSWIEIFSVAKDFTPNTRVLVFSFRWDWLDSTALVHQSKNKGRIRECNNCNGFQMTEKSRILLKGSWIAALLSELSPTAIRKILCNVFSWSHQFITHSWFIYIWQILMHFTSH